MVLLQLNPSIPVEVVGKGSGECLGWIEYSCESHLMWIVALDSDGSVWTVPNPDIRLLKNYTIGRTFQPK